MAKFERYLRKHLKSIVRYAHPEMPPEEYDLTEIGQDLRVILNDVKHEAAASGVLSAVQICQDSGNDLVSEEHARAVLAACLETCPKSEYLTPPEAACELGCSPEKVRAMISRRELVAQPTSQPGSCKKHQIIARAELEAWQSRQAAQQRRPKRSRAKQQSASLYDRYSP